MEEVSGMLIPYIHFTEIFYWKILDVENQDRPWENPGARREYLISQLPWVAA